MDMLAIIIVYGARGMVRSHPLLTSRHEDATALICQDMQVCDHVQERDRLRQHLTILGDDSKS